MSQTPSVGRIVHYVSHGTPVREDGSQAYTSVCRAAIITETYLAFFDPEDSADQVESDRVGLCVLNPTGEFFNQGVKHDEDGRAGGTWHWSERVQ